MENYNHEQIHYETETGMRCDVHSTHGFFVAKHWHNSLEIIMVIDGNMDISISGRNIRLESGGLAVINSRNDNHKVRVSRKINEEGTRRRNSTYPGKACCTL